MAVQPCAGKAVLPLAGGTPAVWTTCLVVFQALLLAAYWYADRLTRLPVRVQLATHAGTLALGAVGGWTLHTVADPAWVPPTDDPVFGLIAYLLAWVGLPFLALAATAPVVQAWFARTGHRHAADPYFLYAASNAGSLLGLLAYPLLVEPRLPLGDQVIGWAAGYALAGGLVVGGGLAGLVGHGATRQQPAAEGPAPTDPGQPSTPIRPLRWLILAALPASLLAGVSAHLTTDIAPVPLVWVVPLGLYLLSFVVVFAGWPAGAARGAGRALAMGLVFVAVALATRAAEPMPIVAGLHLIVFFLACLVCHGELARSRPTADRLTRFYLTTGIGGVLGGLVNAVVAPVVFARVGPAEYPLALVLVALVRPGMGPGPSRSDAIGVLLFAGSVAALSLSVGPDLVVDRVVRSIVVCGLPAVAAFALVRRPARFAGCLGVLLAAGAFTPGPHGRTLHLTRNFFGTLTVTRSDDGRFVRLIHGTTQHGQQAPGDPTPLMYYHPTGPAGRLLAAPAGPRRVAVVGLGCGALAAYARPGDDWTFYEIDPAVERVARDERFFTHLATAAAPVRVVIGDARVRLATAPTGTFDVIVLDAFGSDAVPIHLLTAEAFELYAAKLAPGGVILAHLSNVYLDLPPVVARSAAAQTPPLAAWIDDDSPTDRQATAGKARSIWVYLARTTGPGRRWQPLTARAGRAWRDDFADVLGAWKQDDE